MGFAFQVTCLASHQPTNGFLDGCKFSDPFIFHFAKRLSFLSSQTYFYVHVATGKFNKAKRKDIDQTLKLTKTVISKPRMYQSLDSVYWNKRILQKMLNLKKWKWVKRCVTIDPKGKSALKLTSNGPTSRFTIHNTIQYNTIQHNIIRFNTIQYNTIQYDSQYTIQYDSQYVHNGPSRCLDISVTHAHHQLGDHRNVFYRYQSGQETINFNNM